MLSVVWDNSSDVIGISVRGASGDVTTMLSPTYVKIYSDLTANPGVESKQAGSKIYKDGKALTFQVDARYFKPGCDEDYIVPSNVYDLDFKDLKLGSPTYISSKSTNLAQEEMASMAKLIVRAWQTEDEKTLLMHDLTRKRGTSKVSIRCEANISRMEENALVVVVRDISERFRRFEAEKKVVSETTARLKDAAANRFTRHEVKNGLLAAIGLCDSLNESVQELAVQIAKMKQTPSENEIQEILELEQESNPRKFGEYEKCLGVGDSVARRYLYELDKTLHEVLDTILAEAMARDVIHEVYEPKLERVNVPQLISESMNINTSKASAARFPINTTPSPLPDYALDPQLLKYIHRNAISNACKYGKRGGIVQTRVQWDKEKGQLRMDVVNLPGEKHAEILKLGALASEVVFSPRRRLTMHCLGGDNNQVSASHSSGDGAWIMHKCAKTLGGNCEIKVS